MATFTYDDTATLATDKNDGGVVTDNTKATATEWNQSSNAVMDLRSDMRAGEYHGVKDMSIAPPAVSAAGGARLAAIDNKLCVSENAGPYIWIKAVDYISLEDPRFGAALDGTTDDTAAVNAAIAACAFGSGNLRMRVLVLPDADIKIRSEVLVSGKLGFVMTGQGRWTTRFIVDPLVPGGHGIRINSSQHTTLEGFSVFGLTANPAGNLIYYSYDPVVLASYANVCRDLYLDSDNANAAFDYGINIGSGYGNNSEFHFENILILKFIEAGVRFTGSQQKANTFTACHINGVWDGVATGLNGGKYGVLLDDGNFNWYGGSIGACSIAAVTAGQPNDPVTISGLNSELCYRFYDGGESAGTGTRGVTIQGCRLETGTVFDPNGYIKLAGPGPFTFTSNYLYGQDDPGPQIRISSGNANVAIKIENNDFASLGSDSYSPIINGGSFWLGSQSIKNNIYRTAANQLGVRDEVLDNHTTASLGVGLSISNWNRSGSYRYIAHYSGFFTASGTETQLLCTLPKGTRLKSVSYYNYDAFDASGDPTVTMKLGTTSGGAELMREMQVGHVTVSATQAHWGGQKSDLGALMQVASSGGGHPDFFADQPVYVTLTRSAGNMGNGAVTNFTSGFGFFFFEYEVLPRYVPGA